MAKNIRDFFENLLEYYSLKINVNFNVFSDLKLEYYCDHYSEILLQVGLKKETKIDGRDHEILSEQITGPRNI